MDTENQEQKEGKLRGVLRRAGAGAKKRAKQPSFMVAYLAIFLCLSFVGIFVNWNNASIPSVGPQPNVEVACVDCDKYVGWMEDAEDAEDAVETVMMLLAVLGGVIGASVGTLVSLTSLIAGYKAKTSMIPLYAIRPIVGAAAGLVLYAAIRGGILNAGSGVDVLNPYAIVAVATGAGYAGEKILKRIADTIPGSGSKDDADSSDDE